MNQTIQNTNISVYIQNGMVILLTKLFLIQILQGVALYFGILVYCYDLPTSQGCCEG